jgi:hypothetical protein
MRFSWSNGSRLKRSLCAVVAVAGLATVAAPAHAVTVDMTASGWTGINTNTATNTFGGIGVTAAGTNIFNGTIRQTPYDGPAPGSMTGICQAGGGSLSCARDGFGVGVLDNTDEITGGIVNDVLTVTFDQLVNVSKIHFFDLFLESITEQAKVEFFDGSNALLATNLVNAVNATGVLNGYNHLALALTDVKSIRFTATGSLLNDYALAGIDVTPVPIPAALPLFATGVAAVAWAGRRKRKAAEAVA